MAVFLAIGWRYLVSLEILWLLIGFTLGYLVIWIDRFLYVWYQEDEQLAPARQLFDSGQTNQFFRWLIANGPKFEGKLMDSFLFLIILWFLSLFIISTTANIFGLAMVMGLLAERLNFFSSFVPNWQELGRKLSPSGKVSIQESKIFLGVFWGWFVFLIIAFNL